MHRPCFDGTEPRWEIADGEDSRPSSASTGTPPALVRPLGFPYELELRRGSPMDIVVQQSGWDEGRLVDVKAVLEDVAKPYLQAVPGPCGRDVARCPSTGGAARSNHLCAACVWRPPVDSPIRILLTARGRKWAKFSYQFSHELCHVLSGYEDLEGDTNNWFHEAICYLASLFTLRRMAEAWRTEPPYPHWITYADSLAEYADNEDRNYLKETALLPGETLSSWLASHEEELRACRELRAKNAVVARELLPLFEEEPSRLERRTQVSCLQVLA